MNILVTGGASGLGAAITKQLAMVTSNKVYFTYNKSADLARAIEIQFSNTKAIHCNFEDASSVFSLLSSFEKFDINVLINNALTGLQTTHFHKIESSYFVQSFMKNVLPVIQITQSALLYFRKKKSGKVITILSSYILDKPPIGLSAYVAEKNYLLSLCKSWATENVKFNISSIAISPSFMQTALTADTDERVIEEMINVHPDKKLLNPQDVAIMVQRLLDKTEINGTNLIINSASDIF
ncbi:MAG: SDR family oxidoreductase [Bacteroidota bacterium]|nr:SDR family oxidoreductase [Bacteroidota bacterium]